MQKNGSDVEMAYVACHDCKQMVHFKPVNVEEFLYRYVEKNEPIYCFACFKKRQENKDS